MLILYIFFLMIDSCHIVVFGFVCTIGKQCIIVACNVLYYYIHVKR